MVTTTCVARPSCPLSRERPAPAQRAGRMPTPQRAGRPRYENSSSLYFAILIRTAALTTLVVKVDNKTGTARTSFVGLGSSPMCKQRVGTNKIDPRNPCLRAREAGWHLPGTRQSLRQRVNVPSHIPGERRVWAMRRIWALEPRNAQTCDSSMQRVRPVPAPMAGL